MSTIPPGLPNGSFLLPIHHPEAVNARLSQLEGQVAQMMTRLLLLEQPMLAIGLGMHPGSLTSATVPAPQAPQPPQAPPAAPAKPAFTFASPRPVAGIQGATLVAPKRTHKGPIRTPMLEAIVEAYQKLKEQHPTLTTADATSFIHHQFAKERGLQHSRATVYCLLRRHGAPADAIGMFRWQVGPDGKRVRVRVTDSQQNSIQGEEGGK